MKIGKEEIAKLPRWAQVAFAARCARRVFPLFEKWAKDTQHDDLIGRVLKAIEIAEQCATASAAARAVVPGVVSVVRATAADARADFDSARAGVKTALTKTDVASATAKANVAAKADLALYVAIYAVTAAHDNTYDATAKAADVVSDAGEDVAHEVESDYKKLLEASQANKWTDKTPVSPSVFGPMWPNGEPNGWPKNQESKPDDAPAAPINILQLEFTLPHGADPDKVNELIASILGDLSQVHQAHGGSGLRIVKGQVYEPAAELVPAGGGSQ